MKLKRPNSLCGILLCLMICPLVVAQTTPGAQIRMHYERAQKDLQANQPEDAKLEFQAILKLDPNNAEAHANLGLIAFAGANYEAAAADLRAALKIRPSMWNAQAFLGLSEMRLGANGEARQSLESAFAHLEDKNLRIRVGTALVQLASSEQYQAHYALLETFAYKTYRDYLRTTSSHSACVEL